MATDWLTAQQAAEELGISVLTFYDWLAQSDCGEFVLRGTAVEIKYFQGGRRGQGRIRIEKSEIGRIKEEMRVKPQTRIHRHRATNSKQFPGITVPLGRPD
ncbi:MAG: molybdenum-pterin-binding protein [Gimesia sp.]|uniref:DNA-binding protein n=2 Tax=Gimesia TaxID=1649453 RepID=A0A6I6AKV9_9PLAN|nr:MULTISPECIES: helix-turn-helix domain-containing protein [Gimesia]HAH48250.1 molybdenum-pterin-binding protein [Planctomycetaceae bacterium]MAX39530.1 molybdenum-pterin-binding protein [Gimesia sp.]MBN68677.1 molybdenum-pterin-binding protein [Gimesia sp.]QDT21948.1 Helix-turn-helix domain protein [Gimesia chilikensis]QGQ26242.1 DNA-binding protein [Gimesia benthica]|tara:strand:+ start:1995 stop:2297 length:303 start_codon:yes stop_codon:yes gene_type:complete